MILSNADIDRLAERIALADKKAQLELIVEAPRGAQARLRGLRRFDLTLRTLEALTADTDRGGATVIADGHPLVVRHQRLVGAKQLADCSRVMDAGVEVGVVTDPAWDGVLGLRLRQECVGPRALLVTAFAQAL